MSLCPLSSSLLQLGFCLFVCRSALTSFMQTFSRDAGTQDPALTSLFVHFMSLSIMVIICCETIVFYFCLLNHYAMCMWLKLLCWRLRIKYRINHLSLIGALSTCLFARLFSFDINDVQFSLCHWSTHKLHGRGCKLYGGQWSSAW